MNFIYISIPGKMGKMDTESQADDSISEEVLLEIGKGLQTIL